MTFDPVEYSSMSTSPLILFSKLVCRDRIGAGNGKGRATRYVCGGLDVRIRV